MNEKTKILLQIGLSVLVAMFALLALTLIVFDVQKVANEPIPSVQSDNLCYWKTIQPGQGISESGPGESNEHTNRVLNHVKEALTPPTK